MRPKRTAGAGSVAGGLWLSTPTMEGCQSAPAQGSAMPSLQALSRDRLPSGDPAEGDTLKTSEVRAEAPWGQSINLLVSESLGMAVASWVHGVVPPGPITTNFAAAVL